MGNGGEVGLVSARHLRPRTIRERAEPSIVLLSGSVKDTKDDGLAIHHHIYRVIIKHCGNVATWYYVVARRSITGAVVGMWPKGWRGTAHGQQA